jgi:hypothetical protein
MAILYVVVSYNTVDVEYFYKTGNIFPMTRVRCKGVANEYTLLNRKHTCDARKLLCTGVFTQLG